jgi:hypothetical protein
MRDSRTHILVSVVLVLETSLAREVLRGTAIFLKAQRAQSSREVLAAVGIVLLSHLLTPAHKKRKPHHLLNWYGRAERILHLHKVRSPK